MKKSLIKILIFFAAIFGTFSIYLLESNNSVYAAGHTPHDGIEDHGFNIAKWDRDDALPSYKGEYYLNKDVTLTERWRPDTQVKLCLNGHCIKLAGQGSVIEFRGSSFDEEISLSIYDCSEVEHKYRINEEGLAIVDDTLTENYSTFKGGYLTNSGGLCGNGGCIDLTHGTESKTNLYMSGVNILGNKVTENGAGIYYKYSKGKKCTISLNNVSIFGNVAGGKGAGIYQEASNSDGSPALTLNNVNVSNNRSGVIPAGIYEESPLAVEGNVYVYDNKVYNEEEKDGLEADIIVNHANQSKFSVVGKLDEKSKIGYASINPAKIFDYYKYNEADPNDIFISNTYQALEKLGDDISTIGIPEAQYVYGDDNNSHTIKISDALASYEHTIKYGIAEGTYDLDEAPEYKDYGVYTIYYKLNVALAGEITGKQVITIDKKLPLLPEALTNLEYTGEALVLITVPENAGATFKFKLENGYWSEYIPKGLDIGEYIIYVKATGDDDHANVEIELKASIVTPDKSELQAVIDIAEAYYEENDDNYKKVIFPLWKQTAVARAKVAMQQVSVAELQQAKDELNAELEATKNDIKTITDVDDLISAIGEVSLSNESKVKIDTARTAYDALISAYQEFVKNYEALTIAEATYNSLKTDSDAANAVSEAINSIGEVNLDSKAKIDEVRASYDGLTDTQKDLVTNLETLTTAEVAYASLKADKDAAVATEVKISDIGEVLLTEEVKARIDEARASYDGLTDSQKGLVANLETLTLAEATYATLKANSEAAARVYALINSIGEVALTDEVKARIDEARASYDGLTDSQKLLIENYDELTDAEEEYATILGYKQKGEAVDQKIDEIGALVYTSECKAKIDEAKVIYKILPAEAKAFVTKYEILDSLDESYKKIDSVYKIIASIDKVELNNKSSQEIQNARLAYNALSEEEKALVTNKDILTNAEKEYENLSANSNKNLILILSIAGGSLLVVLLIVLYILFFFVFNSWTLIKYKQKRVLRIGRKNGKVRLMRMSFRILYRDEADVYKLKNKNN